MPFVTGGQHALNIFMFQAVKLCQIIYQPEIILCCISKLSTPFWKVIYASQSKLSKELKSGIKILVDQVFFSLSFFKLWIKTVNILFWSIIQEPLGLLNL